VFSFQLFFFAIDANTRDLPKSTSALETLGILSRRVKKIVFVSKKKKKMFLARYEK
jgi:hypothetical protein